MWTSLEDSMNRLNKYQTSKIYLKKLMRGNNRREIDKMDKTWKRRERQVAKAFNTERTPLSGGNGKQTRSDTLSDKFFIETKTRAKHAVIGLWEKTAEMAKKEKKIPVVALCENRKAGIWLVMKKEDLDKYIEKELKK